MNILFSWDEVKSKSNQVKHGLSFQAAKFVFDDPSHVTKQDRIENMEERWQTVGYVEGLLLVAHTWSTTEDGQEHIRIISARRATKQERKDYEQVTGKHS